MFHGLDNQFLYAAYKVSVLFADDIGNTRTGVGTCFFVKNKRNELCIVSNRHVFDFSYKNSDSSSNKFSLRQIEISGMRGSPGNNAPSGHFSFRIEPNVKFAEDSNNDIACIKNIRALPDSDEPISIDYFVAYSMLATKEEYQERLSICDFLAFPGFPEWHDRLAQRPILRTGTISSDPRFNYSYGDTVRGDCVAYEAFSYGGSSGSPVFAVQKGIKPGPGLQFPGFRPLMLVGINAGHLKSDQGRAHSGISYFYKSTAIIQAIDA